LIQSRTEQRKILAAAQADGTLDTLFWYMVIDALGNRTVPAAVNGWIPVVRVAPDPEESQHYAHLMLEVHKHYSPGILLRLELTAVDVLEEAGVRYFEWGTNDIVCPSCGAVGWESCSCQPTAWRVTEPIGQEEMS
jgi:hypothetical protein